MSLPLIQTPGTGEMLAGDPLELQRFTLKNGLKVFLSVNKAAPRIATRIAFRAGSKHDPADTTGLAHYMEHMLFKGTSKIGALDWEKEAAYLEKISAAFERYRQTTDPEARKAIYREIDQLSGEAAQLTVPGEYDRLVGALGAKGTNAYTWVEQTVYVNDIPSNELERWLRLESERFQMLALRLFHTELETVYEEFNMIQDQDGRKVNQAIREHLYPNHPYGKWTTIGKPEHLKNPSMANIQAFFKQYYACNNMAIILAGDLEVEPTLAMIEQYFGGYEPQEIPEFTYEESPLIQEKTKQTILGEKDAFVDIAWRLGGSATDDPLKLALVQGVLFNEQAGLMDRHLNQPQKLLQASAWVMPFADYATFGIYGKPLPGQTLEEVEALLMEQIARLREGDFPDWLLEAVINVQKLNDAEALEDNDARAELVTASFILDIAWERMHQRYDLLESITKAELVAFAQAHLREDQAVVIYKEQATDPDLIKVEKPEMTPVSVEREALSEFATGFLSQPAEPLEPHFDDFEATIRRDTLRPGLPFDYVRNPYPKLFRMDIIWEMGRLHDPLLSGLSAFFTYLGTAKKTARAVQDQLFKLGLRLELKVQLDSCRLSLSGLEASFAEGLNLLLELAQGGQAPASAWEATVAQILTHRKNARTDRRRIMSQVLPEYLMYGADSPFTNRISAATLQATPVEEVLGLLHRMLQYPYQIYYYGQAAPEQVKQRLAGALPQVDQPLAVPAKKQFLQPATDQRKVFLLDFPMVQSDVILLGKGSPAFNYQEALLRTWFNNYFGYGLSSVVFQEIRESQALAYSTYAVNMLPRLQEQGHYMRAYVGTQPDKLGEALGSLYRLLGDMPYNETSVDQARIAILRRMESDRTHVKDIYWKARQHARLGLTTDMEADVYAATAAAKPADLADYFQQYVAAVPYHLALLGPVDTIDRSLLAPYGEIEVITMDEVFGEKTT